MSLDWVGVAAMALALPGTEPAAHYGRPAVKANGRAVLGTGDIAGSFVLHIDEETKDRLIESDPRHYWQTPHYAGWPALLVRYDVEDTDRLRATIAQAVHQAQARRPRRR